MLNSWIESASLIVFGSTSRPLSAVRRCPARRSTTCIGAVPCLVSVDRGASWTIQSRYRILRRYDQVRTELCQKCRDCVLSGSLEPFFI